MVKFSQIAPAAAIKAADLDANFREVGPATNQDSRQCRFLRTPDGWKLQVFPGLPNETALLTSSGDTPFWLSVSGLLEELVAAGLMAEVVDQLNNGGTISSGALSPGAISGGSVIPNPPSGTAAWRQVERCDGQTMYVWGTDWEE